jgi:hypothetical protein
MDIALNKTEIETKSIFLSFDRIKCFEELLSCELDKVVYIGDSEDEYPKHFLKNQRIERKKMFFSKAIYFKLNDIMFEPTKVYRDNFNSCGYVFYKLKLHLEGST